MDSSSVAGAFGGLSSKEREESHRESASDTDGSVLWGRVDATAFKSAGAFGALSCKERDESHRESAKDSDGSNLWGRVDAIGFKSAADVDRDSPLEGDFRIEAPGFLNKQCTDNAFSLRHLRGDRGAAVTTRGGQSVGTSLGLPCMGKSNSTGGLV
jgi:hypothetical protein